MDNKCVKLYPDRTREYEVLTRAGCEQTIRQRDGRTDRQGDSYMTLFAGGIIMSGFQGAFATGVACQQGTLTLQDTWFYPPF